MVLISSLQALVPVHQVRAHGSAPGLQLCLRSSHWQVGPEVLSLKRGQKGTQSRMSSRLPAEAIRQRAARNGCVVPKIC